MTDKYYDMTMQVAGLKKYLKDFSKIEDKTALQVNLWQEYLMFASIFGIAKEVAKEFKELYPNVVQDIDYNTIIFVDIPSKAGVVFLSKKSSDFNESEIFFIPSISVLVRFILNGFNFGRSFINSLFSISSSLEDLPFSFGGGGIGL